MISIITVNYNQLELTCALLDSIRKLSYSDHEVIVVDNASKQNPQKYLAEHYPEVKFIRSETNLGFSGGNNLGIRASKGDYIFYINNDAELTEGCLETLLALFDRIPDLGIVSPKLCYYPSEENDFQDIIQYVGTTPVNNFTARNETIGAKELDKNQYTKAQPTAYAHGAAMLIPRSVIEKVGLMDEGFFLYYEELDWCDQIRRAGYEIYVEPNALVYHKESVTVGKANPLKTYYINRNRIRFMRRNKTLGQVAIFTLFLLFFTIPKNVLMHVVKGEWTHVKAFLKAIWWNITHPQAGKITKNTLKKRTTSERLKATAVASHKQAS